MGKLDIKEFGLGDLVQKYTQVPGALITRAIEFSPIGYLKAIYNTAQFVKAFKSEKVKAQAAETAAARAEANPDRARQVRQAFRAKTEAEQARVETNRLPMSISCRLCCAVFPPCAASGARPCLPSSCWPGFRAVPSRPRRACGSPARRA